MAAKAAVPWRCKSACRIQSHPKTSQSQWAGPTPCPHHDSSGHRFCVACGAGSIPAAIANRMRFHNSPCNARKYGRCGGGSQPGIDIPRNPVQLRKPSPVRCPLWRRTWFEPPDKLREEDRNHPKKHPFRTVGAFCLRRFNEVKRDGKVSGIVCRFRTSFLYIQ